MNRDGPVPANPGDAASKLIALLARMEEHFDPTLFADPARNILLELFTAMTRGAAVSISDCCVAARVPVSTAWRWIGILESRGLVQRSADLRDGRRAHVQLTDQAYRQMADYIAEVRPILSSLELEGAH